MKPFKIITTIFFVSLIALALSPAVKAQQAGRKTNVTFSAPVEVPGVGAQILPAGKYVFKVLEVHGTRNIVQILSPDETHVYTTILAINNYRLKPTGETVMPFKERAAGQPQAVEAWFYPGENSGQEFVYPKARAVELAKVVQEPVLYIPSELAPEIAKAEPPMEAFEEAPIMAITPKGEEVQVAQVIPPRELPKTASSLPLLALLGLLSLGAGFTLVWLAAKPAVARTK
jgi:hypothetical protein